MIADTVERRGVVGTALLLPDDAGAPPPCVHVSSPLGFSHQAP